MTEFEKNKKRIKTVWRFAKPYTVLFIIAEICMLVTYGVILFLPLNIAMLTDKVLYVKNEDLFGEVIFNFIILFVLNVVFNLLYGYIWQTLSNRYVLDIKNKLFGKNMFLKAETLSNMNSGDVMSRIDGDADQFIHVIQRNLFHFVNSIMICICILCIVGSYNIVLAVILFVTALLPIVFTRIVGKMTASISKKARAVTSELTGSLFEILKGMREIKLLCAKWWATKSVFSQLRKLIFLNNDLRVMDFAVEKGTYFINIMTSLIIYGFCAALIYSGGITIGIFIAVIEYIVLLHRKFNWAMRIYLDWNIRKISIDRVNEILDSECENNSGTAPIDRIEGIEFRNVTFGFNENTVLNDVSFSIQKGERCAIVGPSGVGKTTLSGLLLKFYEPQNGEIYINGRNIKIYKCTDMRKNIGIVQQDILLFDETIRYNLLLGNKNYSDRELIEVCEKVGLSDLINSLPHGLDTKIGMNANDLSGGQKQRIMIARILLKKATTVIFDEATSALDIGTEKMCIDEFVKFSEDTTMIIMSHRLNTIKVCDKIIVMHEGNIDHIGTHDELLKISAIYADMFEKAEVPA